MWVSHFMVNKALSRFCLILTPTQGPSIVHTGEAKDRVQGLGAPSQSW